MKKLSKKEMKSILAAGINCGGGCPEKSVCCNGRCIIPEHQIEQENCY